MTFEQYLEEQFMELREVGGMPITKDNYESMSENWFERLDVQEVIDYAEKWGNEIIKKGYDKNVKWKSDFKKRFPQGTAQDSESNGYTQAFTSEIFSFIEDLLNQQEVA